ncbi:MAG: outer membrane beta-barrel protein, partial [Rhodospirillales bacterium]|nr:outer membrane beta-barrel protein [Rhodospirillales bacterium]
PGIQAATIYDSNIYATGSGKRADWLGTISPKLSIESDWKRHSLTADVQTDLTGYVRSPHENTVDWNANVEGRIDATDTTQVVLGGTYIAAHEDRSSPDAVEGFTPTPYRETNGYAGVLQRVGDFAIRLGGAVEHVVFGNVDSANGIINNHDRDRNRITFGGLVRYDANPGFRPYVEAMGDLRQYNQTHDDFGYARTSNGYRLGVGALYRLAPSLRGDIFVGMASRKADDPRFRENMQLAFDGSLRWQATPGTVLVLYTERSIEETTLFASPGYIYTVFGGRVEQRLTERLTGLARLAWGHSDYLQSTRADNEADMSVGLSYRITPKVTIGVDYRYTRRASNTALANYDRNEVYFRIGSQF